MDNINKNVQKIKPNGLFCNYIFKAIPLAFDESMSYYECLCGLLSYLKNTVIPAINNNADALIELQNAMTELQQYVDNYFDNLDVQEEINNKLDDMVESGELQEIIADYLNSKAIFGFDTVESMKSATNLINGSYAKTLGYYSKNDHGGALYKIRTITNQDTVDNMFIIPMNDNTLVAELIYNNVLNIMQLGYTDDIGELVGAFSKNIEYLEIPNGSFHIKTGTYSTLHLKGTKNSNLIVDGQILVNDIKLMNLNVQASGIERMFKPNGSNAKVYIDNINVNSLVDYFMYIASAETSSVSIDYFKVCNSNFENLGVSPFRLLCSGSIIIMENNNFKNIGTNESTRTSCLQAGSPVDWETVYFNDVIIKNNICYNLTSADSTGSDSSECQAFKVSVNNAIINDNKIESINGTGADHEGIYVKGKNVQINNNILINCGQGDGAITTKPVRYLSCTGNVIKTIGNGALIRANIGVFANNTIDTINSNGSTYYCLDIGDVNSTKLLVENNDINSNDTTIMIYLRYIAGTFRNNLINGENIENCLAFQNEISGQQIIDNNIFNLKSSKLIKVNSVATGFEILFNQNIFNLDTCIDILQYTSGTNKVITSFENNKFNLKNNTTGVLMNSNGVNSNSILKLINNIFDFNEGSITRLLYDYNKELHILNNIFKNATISYFCSLTSVSKDIIDI